MEGILSDETYDRMEAAANSKTGGEMLEILHEEPRTLDEAVAASNNDRETVERTLQLLGGLALVKKIRGPPQEIVYHLTSVGETVLEDSVDAAREGEQRIAEEYGN